MLFSLFSIFIVFLIAMTKPDNKFLGVMSCIFTILLLVFPAQIIFILSLYIILYCSLFNLEKIFNNIFVTQTIDSDKAAQKRERLNALKEAKIYLAPYKDIWSDLKLINKYCKLTLGKDGVTIEGFEKNYPQRHFKIISNGVHTTEELWNLFCKYFSWNKSYNGLIEDCKKYGVTIIESIGNQKSVTKNNTVIPIQERTLANELKEENSSSKNEPQKEKLDINNCSEAELTELPGISIVLSKKIIKKREEIGGFKTVEDFFIFLKLKPHIEKQLRTLIKIEKMKGSIIKPLNKERTIDL